MGVGAESAALVVAEALAVEQRYPSRSIGNIGHARQACVASHGESVARGCEWPGIGHGMHEAPAMSRHIRPGTGKRLKSGLVIAIEPMVNAVAPDAKVLEGKWTAVTNDLTRSAHFEQSIAITDNGPWVSSRAFSPPGNRSSLADP